MHHAFDFTCHASRIISLNCKQKIEEASLLVSESELMKSCMMRNKWLGKKFSFYFLYCIPVVSMCAVMLTSRDSVQCSEPAFLRQE